MRKTTLSCSVAALILLALALTGCPNTATIQPEGGKTPPATTETKTIEAVTTSGTMGKPETKADGSVTLTTTDSTGGKYTFTQPSAPVASIRSGSSGSTSDGGTWDYTNSEGIKQYAGNYTGDITSSGANSLNLEVTQAADPSGKLQAVTEPKSFNFGVSDSGTFSATIPAVEVVVQVEPPQPEYPPASLTPSLIKTVRLERSYSAGKDYYYDSEDVYTISFYSDKTFIWRCKFTRTLNEVNFSYTLEGPALVGTYTGEPSTDGTVMLNTEKWNEILVSGGSIMSPEQAEIFDAYRNGKTSKTITITEADLTPFTMTYPITISGDTFSEDGTFVPYTPNADNSTSFTVEAHGDDAEEFKLCYQTAENSGDGSYSNFSGQEIVCNLSETIVIDNAANNTAISPYIFIDKDGNNTMDSGTDVVIDLSMIDLKPGHHVTAVVDIEKHSINFTIKGNTDQYQDIHVSAGYYGPTVPMTESKIDVYEGYIRDSGFIRSINLTAQNHIQGEYSTSKQDISDSIDLYPGEEEIPSSITLTLYDKLEDGKKITITESPVSGTSPDEEKRFRFQRETDGNLIFYIPTGTGSDGAFLSSAKAASYTYPKNCLIAFTYLGLRPMMSAVDNNHTYQFTGLIQNMQDVVDFLENRMKLTVEGKDLFEQIKQQ